MYEYAQLGGLDKLYEDGARLTWQRRLKVACGLLNALCYFHNPSEATGGSSISVKVKLSRAWRTCPSRWCGARGKSRRSSSAR